VILGGILFIFLAHTGKGFGLVFKRINRAWGIVYSPTKKPDSGWGVRLFDPVNFLEIKGT
jgi:hypothetical protein